MAVAVCRALKVLCVADDRASLPALKAAAVAADWELAPGADDLRSAPRPDRRRAAARAGGLRSVRRGLVAIVRERFPAMRIVTDRDTPGATVVATSVDEVRGLVLELPRPGGPVGA